MVDIKRIRLYNADIERPTTYIPQRHLRGFSYRLKTVGGSQAVHFKIKMRYENESEKEQTA